MSELEAYIAPTADGTGLADYYLKSEADKAITRHKYKRCLAIADSCALRTVVAKMENRSFPTPKNSRRMILYPKWYKRWLAIAETFKTNSTALQGKGN